ncbi:MAG: hypothetical protein QOE71_1368, partial [Pseudonocardiales bacterium]|nr:hypothetical protein [Pseudonocardiales bacterium]
MIWIRSYARIGGTHRGGLLLVPLRHSTTAGSVVPATTAGTVVPAVENFGMGAIRVSGSG